MMPGTSVDLATHRSSKSESKTLMEYEYRISEMRRLFILIGDWQSACLSDRNLCPEKPLPMLPVSIALYITWKCDETGAPLLHPHTKAEVKTISGDVMMCHGDWHNWKCLNKFRAAFNALHDAYDLKGNYCEACPTSKSSNNIYDDHTVSSNWQSCSVHAGAPQLKAKGNGLMSEEAKKAFNMWKDGLRSKHTEKGSCHLLPLHLHQIRHWVVNSPSNNLWHLQTYTMILFGIKLFLRADELLKIKLEHLDSEKDYFVDHEDCIKSLAVHVFGKNDPEKGVLL